MMNATEIIKRGGMDLLKGASAALASLLGLVIGGMVAGWLHLSPATVPAYISMTILMPLMIISEYRLIGSPWGCEFHIRSNCWWTRSSRQVCMYGFFSPYRPDPFDERQNTCQQSAIRFEKSGEDACCDRASKVTAPLWCGNGHVRRRLRKFARLRVQAVGGYHQEGPGCPRRR
jgi:hypothetical protein